MWYSASIMFVAEHPERPRPEPLWEEQVILINSSDERTAKAIADGIGRRKEHEYRNAEGALVKWRFHAVESVYPIEAEILVSGVELFSRFLRNAEAKNLLTPFQEGEN